MIYQKWNPGLPIASPVYLDANILVGSVINGHRLYPKCARLLADLLSSNATLLFSHVAYQEALWAIVKVAFSDLTNQNTDKFRYRFYQQNHKMLFQKYGRGLRQ